MEEGTLIRLVRSMPDPAARAGPHLPDRGVAEPGAQGDAELGEDPGQEELDGAGKEQEQPTGDFRCYQPNLPDQGSKITGNSVYAPCSSHRATGAVARNPSVPIPAEYARVLAGLWRCDAQAEIL
jgi:hypothetical protein